MVQFESSIKHLSYSQEQVYNKLADLNNLTLMREKLELLKEKAGGKIEDFSFDRDSITLKVQGINLTLRIVETRKGFLKLEVVSLSELEI